MSKICYRENSYKVLTILRKTHLTLKTVIMRPRRYAKSPMNYISALLFFVTHSAYHCKYSYYNSFLNMTIKFQTKTVHVPSIDPFISVKKPNIKLILLQVVMKKSVNMESFFKL